MKKEEREQEKKERNQEDQFSGSDRDRGEYGFEYEFFITEQSSIVKKTSTILKPKPGNRTKGEDTTDQSTTFFLPDFFSHEY
jgi:hypothetical protein